MRNQPLSTLVRCGNAQKERDGESPTLPADRSLSDPLGGKDGLEEACWRKEVIPGHLAFSSTLWVSSPPPIPLGIGDFQGLSRAKSKFIIGDTLLLMI